MIVGTIIIVFLSLLPASRLVIRLFYFFSGGGSRVGWRTRSFLNCPENDVSVSSVLLWPAGLNVGVFFSAVIKASSFKLCMIKTSTEFFLFMLVSISLTTFERHISARYVKLKVPISCKVLIRMSSNFLWLHGLDHVRKSAFCEFCIRKIADINYFSRIE